MNQKPLTKEVIVRCRNTIASHRITKPLVLILEKVREIRCYINRKTQPKRSNKPVNYSVSAVYISHHQVGNSSQKRIKRTADTPKNRGVKS